MRGRILVLGCAGLAGLLLWAVVRAPLAVPPPTSKEAPAATQLAPAPEAAIPSAPGGQPPAAPLRRPVADIVDSRDLPMPAAPSASPTASPAPAAPTAALAPSPVPTDPPPLPVPTVDPYREWIHEARLQYPYPESEEQMYQLLLCESSGNPAADSPDGLYHGLFQYSDETWSGDWNPYRDRSIYDPQAQIWATACAWNLGMQQQWGCYTSLSP